MFFQLFSLRKIPSSQAGLDPTTFWSPVARSNNFYHDNFKQYLMVIAWRQRRLQIIYRLHNDVYRKIIHANTY